MSSRLRPAEEVVSTQGSMARRYFPVGSVVEGLRRVLRVQ